MPGLLHHLILTLRLNFRSKQALIYGYVVPIFFLIAFGSVFRSGTPPLVRELGQLLTITTLGGACFGMPTAMVGERERGVWRRYRLLPAATGSLVVSVMVARFFIIAGAAVLQIVLAKLFYGMPMPGRPWELAAAFLVVAFAFEGMGLVIAMLADTVSAVQALGQAIFLPMIMIGGVGLPLRTLPAWAQTVAGYLPGRYAVEALQACVNGNGLREVGFSLAALAIIGGAGCIAGTNMFRWDVGQKMAPGARAWVMLALASWACVGLAAQRSGRLHPVGMTERSQATTLPAQATTLPSRAAFEAITDAEIQSITYDDLQDDSSNVTPLIHSLDDLTDETKQWMSDFRAKLSTWPPGNVADPVQRTRNLLSVAAVADVAQNPYEPEIPYVLFQKFQADMPKEQLEKLLAYIILNPDGGKVLTTSPEFGISGEVDEPTVRDRSRQYAKKLLGRLVGKLGPFGA